MNINQNLFKQSNETGYQRKSSLLKRGLKVKPFQRDLDASVFIRKSPNLRIYKRSYQSRDLVRVVTWTSSGKIFENEINSRFEINDLIWVTAFPEFKHFCSDQNLSFNSIFNVKKFDPSSSFKALRMLQYMGLPPIVPTQRQYVVTFQVQLKDLIRPCFSPLIHQEYCDATYIWETNKGLNLTKDFDNIDIQNLTSHQRWFYNMVMNSGQYDYNSQSIEDIYPWTRLGYTFDYGPQQKDSDQFGVGLNEFIIRSNAEVIVESVQEFKDYCK